jgi:hypothetical protein
MDNKRNIKSSLYLIVERIMNGILEGIKKKGESNLNIQTGGETKNAFQLDKKQMDKISRNNPELDEIYAKLDEFDDSIMNIALSISQNMINKFIELLLYYTGNQNLINTSGGEMNVELKKKILLLADILNNISNDPEILEAISEIFKAITILMLDIIDEIKPELDLILDDALEMTYEMGMKAAHSFATTGIAMIKLVINESIPIIGPLVSAIHSFMVALGSLIEIYNIYVARTSNHAVRGTTLYFDTRDKIKKGLININQAVSNMSTTYKNTVNKVGTKVGTKVGNTMNGGSNYHKTNKQINPKILKNENRLKKTMKIFQNTLSRVNYSNYGNGNDKCKGKHKGKTRKRR